ncbi:MAG: hypothetical protein ABSE73_08205 [Planctomycetota bacterium]
MTQVELHRKHDGTWEMRWQFPGGKVQGISSASTVEVARRVLGLGNFQFVRGLELDGR